MGDYVDVADVPVIGPDPYQDPKKKQAIRYAEDKLEGDVNEGETISSPTDLHELATNAYASYILAVGPMDPADAQSGDFADAGDEVGQFANQLHNMYRSARSTILASEADGGSLDDRIGMGGTR
jgi:hypothetical protein